MTTRRTKPAAEPTDSTPDLSAYPADESQVAAARTARAALERAASDLGLAVSDQKSRWLCVLRNHAAIEVASGACSDWHRLRLSLDRVLERIDQPLVKSGELLAIDDRAWVESVLRDLAAEHRRDSRERQKLERQRQAERRQIEERGREIDRLLRVARNNALPDSDRLSVCLELEAFDPGRHDAAIALVRSDIARHAAAVARIRREEQERAAKKWSDVDAAGRAEHEAIMALGRSALHSDLP